MSTGLTRHETWYGRDEAPVRARSFSAGPVSFDLVGIDLKSVRWGSVELVDRVYMSVRDQNWDTIAPAVSNLRVERPPDGGVRIRFSARNASGLVDLEWQGAIDAGPDGTISYGMRGLARSAFRYCRIGFCLLHSEAAAAGRAFRATTPAGIVEGRLPELVGPQLVVDGRELPLFPPCSALAVEIDGLEARAAFEGSLFVMEDQRNWTDASFKTCCEAGGSYPYPASPGQAFSQRVTISAAGRMPAARPRASRIHELQLEPAAAGPWPALGLGTSTEIDRPLSAREAGRLAAVRLDHLRVDLHLGSPAWPAELARTSADAAATGARLEVALFGDPASPAALDQLGEALSAGREGPGARVGRLIVFDEASAANHVTPAAWLEAVASRLGPLVGSAPIHGGTDGDFAELNRERAAVDPRFGLAYAINPQVHAFDEGSLAETLASQGTTIRTAREFAGGEPLAVSPITLRQRFNPSATESAGRPDPDVLPAAVDPRQVALFAGGWTLGSIASLAAAGAASITYFETVGWRGVIEAAGHPPRPRAFRSRPGQVFPIYHVLADLADRTSAGRLPVDSDDPTTNVGLALIRPGRTRVLVANLTPRVQQVAIGPLMGRTAWVRQLDDRAYDRASVAPARFRGGAERVRVRAGTVRLRLAPFAYLRLDAAGG